MLLKGEKKHKDFPAVLIRDRALLKTPNLPEMAVSFDFVKPVFHQNKSSLTQSYLERKICVCVDIIHRSLPQARQPCS